MKLFGAGGGGIAIAGHHVSYGLLAVLLSVPVAGLAIYQFRSGALGLGGGVSSGVADTTDPTTGQNTLDTSGGGGGASDAALQNFGQQISDLNAYLRSVKPLSAPAAARTNVTNYYSMTKTAASTKALPSPAPIIGAGGPAYSPTHLSPGILSILGREPTPTAPKPTYSKSTPIAI